MLFFNRSLAVLFNIKATKSLKPAKPLYQPRHTPDSQTVTTSHEHSHELQAYCTVTVKRLSQTCALIFSVPVTSSEYNTRMTTCSVAFICNEGCCHTFLCHVYTCMCFTRVQCRVIKFNFVSFEIGYTQPSNFPHFIFG